MHDRAMLVGLCRSRSVVVLAQTALLVGALTSCTYPATEVQIVLGTDVPRERTMHIHASVRANAASVVGSTADFVYGAAPGAITLPGSFAVTPGAGPRDGTVVLEITAAIDAFGASIPSAQIRRVARFSFTPRVQQRLPIFLALACANPTNGCTTTGVACTVSQYCEDHGSTCGDRGECVAIDAIPRPIPDGGVGDFDGAFETPDATTDTFVDAPDVDAVDAVETVDAVDIPLVDTADAPASIEVHLRSPLSGSYVGSNATPPFAFNVVGGATGSTGEYCRDLAMTTRCTSDPTALTPGVWHWRITAVDATRGAMGQSPVWSFYLPRVNATVSTVGPTYLDVNNDGFADVAAIGSSSTAPNVGSVAVYFGSPAGPAPTPSVVREGPVGSTAPFATNVAAAGDLDGDGFGDLVVSRWGPPSVIVFSGSATGLSPSGVSITNAAAGVTFGRTVAGLGDVDADGYGDLAIGAPSDAGGAGRVYIYRGSATGIRTTPSYTIDNPVAGDQFFGMSIAAIGDTNRDTVADFVVGAPGTSAGNVHVFVGRISAAPTLGGTFNGLGLQNNGSAVGSAGDVDNDGNWDFLASGVNGVILHTFDPMSSTRQIPSPSANVTSTGDVNDDGHVDWMYCDPGFNASTGRCSVIDGASSPGLNQLFFLDGMDGASGFGGAIATAGDIDGNGYVDFVVGETGRAMPSHTRVFLVTATGLAARNGIDLVSPGAAPDSLFGTSVAANVRVGDPLPGSRASVVACSFGLLAF